MRSVNEILTNEKFQAGRSGSRAQRIAYSSKTWRKVLEKMVKALNVIINAIILLLIVGVPAMFGVIAGVAIWRVVNL